MAIPCLPEMDGSTARKAHVEAFFCAEHNSIEIGRSSTLYTELPAGRVPEYTNDTPNWCSS